MARNDISGKIGKRSQPQGEGKIRNMKLKNCVKTEPERFKRKTKINLTGKTFPYYLYGICVAFFSPWNCLPLFLRFNWQTHAAPNLLPCRDYGLQTEAGAGEGSGSGSGAKFYARQINQLDFCFLEIYLYELLIQKPACGEERTQKHGRNKSQLQEGPPGTKFSFS